MADRGRAGVFNTLRETREAWPALGAYERFEQLVCLVLTFLVGLEFNHSVLGVLERKRHLVQVRTVVLIALLAVVRKFIVLDLHEAEPLMLAGLAAAVLALGAVHWLVRDQDRRDLAEGGGPRGP